MEIKPLPFPLQMYNYWVTEFKFSTPRSYISTESGENLIPPDEPNFIVKSATFLKDEDVRDWVCWLAIELKAPEVEEGQAEEGASIQYPYTFYIELYGFFRVNESFEEERIKHLVDTSAPSLLYSAAREVIASATGHGPRKPVLLPTVTFYRPRPPEERGAEETTEPLALPKPKRTRRQSKAK